MEIAHAQGALLVNDITIISFRSSLEKRFHFPSEKKKRKKVVSGLLNNSRLLLKNQNPAYSCSELSRLLFSFLSAMSLAFFLYLSQLRSDKV